MDSDDSTSSTTSDDSEVLPDISEDDMRTIIQYEKDLKQNPNLYDTYLKYLSLLKKSNLTQKLDKARHTFQHHFPLPEQLWLEWTEDERDPTKKIQLLETAVDDYLSIPIWTKLLALVTPNNDSSLLKWRDLSQRALESCGLHFSRGHEIWKSVIDVEAKLDESSDDQVERIRQLYFECLQSPILNTESILQSYSQWEEARDSMSTDPPPQVQSMMESTKAAVEARKKYEEALSTEDPTDLLAAYVAYCTMEERHGSLQQIECIYERAIAAFPVTHSLWLRYGNYFEKKSANFEKLQKIFHRATRNCPWLGQFWEKLIRLAALHEKDAASTEQIYHNALKAGLRSEEDYMVVILSWLDFLRCDYWRQKTSDVDVSFDQLDSAFEYGWTLMRTYFPKYVDPQHRITRYWADCSISIGGSIDKARGIWENFMGECPLAAERYDTWMYYMRMEAGEKHHGPARKLYNRAFHSIKDPAAKYTIAMEWLRHEGMTGTPKQYSSAVTSTQKFLDEYAASLASPQIAQAAKQKSKKQPKLSEAEVTDLRRHKGKQNKAKADGEKEFYDDKNTLFVSRIPSETKDEEIRGIFEDCGDMEAVRHLRHPNGNSKGRAYVVFKTAEGMKQGLAKNNTELNGSKLLIQISRPTRVHPGIPLTGRPRRPPRLPKPKKEMSNDDFRDLLL